MLLRDNFFSVISVLFISNAVLLMSCGSKTEVDNMNDNDFTSLFDDAENVFADENSNVNKDGLDYADDFDGIKIVASVESSARDNKILISGLYRTFVNCGSQRAIWQGFTSHFNYVAKDLDNDKVYETQFAPLSISHAPMPSGPDGVPMPDSYSQMPCEQFDMKYFQVELYNQIKELPRDLNKLEVYVKIYNLESNRIIVNLKNKN